MFRLIGYILIAIVGITLLRGVLGIVGRLFSEAASRPDAPRAAQPNSPTELKACSVCGTFVPASNVLTVKQNQQTRYFCSAACRDSRAA